MKFSPNTSLFTEEFFRIACDISGVDIAVFDASNTLKHASPHWLKSHGLDQAAILQAPAMQCWPADDASDRVALVNRVRASGVPVIFVEQCDGRRIETAGVPMNQGDVLMVSCPTGINRAYWPARLPQPELVGAVAAAVNRTASLSRREREVFTMLAGGMTIKQVAESLERSEKTIEGHRDSIYRKLNVNNRAEIAIIAMEAGLLPSKR